MQIFGYACSAGRAHTEFMPSVCPCARYLSPRAQIFEYLVPCGLVTLDKFRRCGLVGESMALGTDFEVSKPHAIPSLLPLFSYLQLKT